MPDQVVFFFNEPKTSFMLILLRVFLVIVRCFLLLINKIEIEMQFCLSTIVFNGGGLGNRTRAWQRLNKSPTPVLYARLSHFILSHAYFHIGF